MKHEAIIGIALSALTLFGNLSIAHAQADCKTLVKPSPFGPDDQIGATNRITPAVTKAAAAEIQTGAVVPKATVTVTNTGGAGSLMSRPASSRGLRW